MNLKKYLFALFFGTTAILISCSTKDLSQGKTDTFEYLKKCMSGEFSSMLQSQQDSDFFDIRLRMVPIWSSTPSVFYLYVEQAVSTSIDKPYRQRIYKVEKLSDNDFVSHIYTVASPSRLIGKKGDDPIFQQLTADSLQIKDGCEVFLKYHSSTKDFSGATKDGTCPSERQGAKYASSKVTITADQMVSWDQGWNEEGKQVWGATKGGYIFVKQK
jgi:hypothetical protein